MSSYPVLEFDWKEMPNIADNIWNAQMSGWERVLTYRGPLPDAMGRQIRSETMKYEVKDKTYRIPTFPKPNLKGDLFDSRDEYPFACTKEGSASDGRRKVCVGHVPSMENNKQGGMLRAFILKHGLRADGENNKFEVRVINHPRGPVLP